MRKLESLQAWQTGKALSRAAYGLTLVPPLSRHLGLADQIRRAAVSIPANIAEGYALGTTPQFLRFLKISLGSAKELATHLDLVGEFQLARVDATARAVKLADEEVALLVGLIKALGGRSRRAHP
jgi:four helix bundle protein